MSIIKKLKYFILSFIVLSSVFTAPCLAKDNKDEEKPFTEVKNIDTGSVKTLENKTYDDEITIKEIYINGNNLVDTEKILQALNIKTGSKFDRNAIQEELKKIYRMGYFTEKIKAVPRKTGSGITLYIQVEENFPVTGFTVSGNKSVETSEILDILTPQQGLPQNIVEINKSTKEIEKLYADKGYILARVAKISDDPDGVINIEINEGRINSVNISGNTKTKDYVIKRSLTVKPDEIYNENKVKQDIARLFGSQYFSDVRRVISISPDDPNKYDLTIEVDEKRTGSISLGGGVDTQTGFFGTAGYTDKNLRGLGEELSLNFTMGSGILLDSDAIVSKMPLQFEANFIEPRIKNSLTSLRVSAFVRDMASYQVPMAIERRFGGEVELARPIKRIPNLAGSVSMGVERIDLREGDEDEIKAKFAENGYTDTYRISERFNQLNGGTYLTLGPSLVFDTRNNIINTTDGWYASTSINESFKIFGDAGSFGKVSFSVKKFTPIANRSTFILGGKIGSELHGNIPEFAMFRLGGPYSIRGFREGEVGYGQGFMMGTAEFRTPIPFIDRVTSYKFFNDIRLAFFSDSGKVFKKTLMSDIYNRPGSGITLGSGVIVSIPFLGPLRFDYGYPITNVGKDNRRGAFSFGIGDRY